MRRWLALALCLWASAASAQVVGSPSYLIFPTEAACLARSKQQCQALGCDGVLTKYWWSCIGPLSAGLIGPAAVTAGSYAIQVQSNGPFGATTATQVSPTVVGLATAEQMRLVSQTAIAPLLPAAINPAATP